MLSVSLNRSLSEDATRDKVFRLYFFAINNEKTRIDKEEEKRGFIEKK